MVFFTSAARGPLFFENIGYAAAVLFVLAMVRTWIFYRFQMRAIELIAPVIRKEKWRQLSSGSGSPPAFRLSLRADLGMIFDLSKWRFRDFYPDIEEDLSS